MLTNCGKKRPWAYKSVKAGGIVSGADVVVATAVAFRRALLLELPSATVPPDDQSVYYDKCKFAPILKANMLTKSA